VVQVINATDPVGLLAEVVRKERERVDAKLDRVEGDQLRFRGVHESGRSYPRNSLVVKRGGLWVATADTTATPGTGADWQLAVKSGEASKAPSVA
jgi:hypothetical protein